jgi:hypothetical protein
MEESDALDNYIDELINRELCKLLEHDIGPYTCQFLTLESGKGLRPFASGILAELGGSYYILTASHVIESWSNDNKLFIEIEGGRHISIVGKACGTEMEKEEKFDVAYIKLKSEIVPILKRWYKFITIDRFLYHEKLFDEANYCAYGFPVANPKNEKGKTIGAGYFVVPNQDKVFDHYGFNALSHYVLEMQGKPINIKTGQPEKLKVEHYGLSGGGLWYTNIECDDDCNITSEAHLIGIMIEFRKGKYYSLIANRIETLLTMLYQNEGFDSKGLKKF